GATAGSAASPETADVSDPRRSAPQARCRSQRARHCRIAPDQPHHGGLKIPAAWRFSASLDPWLTSWTRLLWSGGWFRPPSLLRRFVSENVGFRFLSLLQTPRGQTFPHDSWTRKKPNCRRDLRDRLGSLGSGTFRRIALQVPFSLRSLGLGPFTLQFFLAA